MKPSVAIVGIVYDLETIFNREVAKSGADTAEFKTERVVYIDHNYQTLFAQLGCHLSVISPEGDPEYVTRFDMLVIPGGPDVNPALYGQAPHPLTSFDPVRDRFEQQAIGLLRLTRIFAKGFAAEENQKLKFFHPGFN